MPVLFSYSSYRYSYSGSGGSTCTSNNSNKDESEKVTVLSEVMALVTALLRNYRNGLKIWKLQEFLLVKHVIDIEKFSISHGYRDTVEFIEQKMPQLVLKYKTERFNIVVIEPHSDLEDNSKPASTLSDPSASDSQCQNEPVSIAVVPPEVNLFHINQSCPNTMSSNLPSLNESHNALSVKEHNSKPASTLSDPSASDSQCQNEPASIAVVPPEVNLFHTNQSCPKTMSSNLPSFHESHNILSVKAKSSSFSSILSQQPNPCQPSVKSVTEETPGSSQVLIFQPSTALDELKQQVAQILAKYPRGISLFQFRIVYSAIFKQHFPVGNASSTKQHLLEMPDILYMKGHGVQTLLLPVSPDMSPAKPGQPASSKVENVAVVSNLSLVSPEPVTKPAVKTFDSHSVLTSPLNPSEKPGSKDCCSSNDLSLNMLLVSCQEQKKARTSLPNFSDQFDLSKVEDIPVLPGRSLPKDESLIIPESFLMPAVPRAAVMPVLKPPNSFLQYYQSVRVLEDKENKPFTELHTQSIPGSIKVMETNKYCLNDPHPKLREVFFIPHCFAALPTYSQGTVCDENLQPGILKPRFATPTKSKISDTVPSVDSTPVPPVLVKPSEIHPPRGASQNSNSILPMLPIQPPPPILSTEQRNYNRAISEFDSFSEAQKQSRALQHFSSPDSSAKRSSASSLPRNFASCFPSKSQQNHQLQQPTHARLDDLQSTSVSLEDKNLRKASLDRVSPVAIYPRKPTYVNPLETSSTTESFIACSVSGSLHTSSVITTNSRASSSVSSRTTAVSPASSPLDFPANSYDQIASAKITSNSSPLFSETQASTQQKQYSRAASTVISNTKATSPTSWSPESITCSHHQFAYASSRTTSNSSNTSSETYAFTHQGPSTQASKTIIASNAKTVSSCSSPLDSTISLPCQHAYASTKATSTSNVLSKSTAYHTPNADLKTSLNHAPPTQNDCTSSLSKQGDQSASLQEKQVTHVSRIYDGCIIL